jgi:hypothetical protein
LRARLPINYLRLLPLVFSLLLARAGAVNPGKGFKALAVYDYFKARANFLKINKKKTNAYACFGLAVISSRNDNPFSNTDSATKYINLSYRAYLEKPQAIAFSGFIVDSVAILRLADSIAVKQFNKARKKNTVEAYNFFLKNNRLANHKLLKQAVYQRDEVEFNHLLMVNKSDTTELFIVTHPLSSFYSEALILKDRELYDEYTASGTAAAYRRFIQSFPKNVMINTAYEKLFLQYRQRSDIEGLSFFVKHYPGAPQVIEAWKLLFSLTVKAYSFSELKRFLEEYPEFPLKNSILKELELNKLVIYKHQWGDLTGFIGEDGKFVIAPVYDAASDFYEGLSVVTKNDSVFYINKENVNPFGTVYTDAMVFHNGIAPVKQNDKWSFINRQGQVISKTYDEINELANGIYVVKINDHYGALDQYGQPLIEPRFDKLGDFKNDYAYYVENGLYGFVSTSGKVHKPEFDWISDFDDEQTAIVRQNNKYGLVHGLGKKILDATYDQVVKAGPGVFLVVNNTSYGFFDPKGCFIAHIGYDYLKEKTPDFYASNGFFRLMKKNGQQIMDENGQVIISIDKNYKEINFAANGLMRVLKKKKYGYVDRKLNVVIPFKYDEASDFKDSVALVKLKEKYLMIDVQGKELFESADKIEKLSTHYFKVSNEQGVNAASVEKINNRLLIITLTGGEIKLIND